MQGNKRFEDTQLGQLSYKLQAFIATQLPVGHKPRPLTADRQRKLEKHDSNMSHFFIADVAPQFNPDTGKTQLNVDMPSIIEGPVLCPSPSDDDVFVAEPPAQAPADTGHSLSVSDINIEPVANLAKTKRPPVAVLTRTGHQGFGSIR